jgi:capsular exopolysaccharide synthesis family protein
VKGPDDLERYLPGLPVLGAIPLQRNGRKRLLGIVSMQVNGRKKRLTGHAAHANVFDPGTEDWVSAEQYRTIRTNILLASHMKGLSSLLITSPGENEGKTTLAVNLAQALAQLQGLRVVLINADLRKVVPVKILGLERADAKGLAHYLMGETTLEGITYPTQLANLWVIPHGQSPSNPSELLHSTRMAELLNYLIQGGYQVIIDAPPVLAVADAMILSAQVDGVVLAISEGETNREACLTAINRITSCGGKLIGVVLQKARSAHMLSYARPYMPVLN